MEPLVSNTVIVFSDLQDDIAIATVCRCVETAEVNMLRNMTGHQHVIYKWSSGYTHVRKILDYQEEC